MRIVTNKELSSYKILPFDLYNESNFKVLSAGEALTPGKLIMLKNYPKLFTEDIFSESPKNEKNSGNKSNLKKLSNFSFDLLDISDFETVVNKDSIIKMDFQARVKYFYKKTLDLLQLGYYEEGLLKLNSLVNIIITNIFKQVTKSKKGSQVRFLGEYEICHPLNVAIISGLIAKRLETLNIPLEHVVLTGLIHDIGKLSITETSDGSALLTTNEDEVANHTTLGYELIKNRLNLPDYIANAALEHHENNDGTGYPQGLSNDYIAELSQIINVANYYDNLACNRTIIHVMNNRDALRAMLEVGTKKFSAKMLYTFVHMFNYDDSKDFNDMIV